MNCIATDRLCHSILHLQATFFKKCCA